MSFSPLLFWPPPCVTASEEGDETLPGSKIVSHQELFFTSDIDLQMSSFSGKYVSMFVIVFLQTVNEFKGGLQTTVESTINNQQLVTSQKMLRFLGGFRISTFWFWLEKKLVGRWRCQLVQLLMLDQ